MRVLKIYSMTWGNAAQTSVRLVADTDEGSNLEIGTPYSSESIIWDAVRAYPVSQIQPYQPPPAPPEDPVAKLQSFLRQNPDVLAMLQSVQQP